MAKLFALFILSLVAIGLLIHFDVSFSWFGHLPGDIAVEYRSMCIYLPLTTSLLVSAALAALLWLFRL